ncbi:MAG: NusA-like transcription termination signal-binding factor [Candidatus Woesearchaeota archaeon]
MRVSYDSDAIKLMNLVESLTSAKIKDLIVEPDRYIFIVEENDVGKAIGKNGVNIKRLERLFKKKVKVVGFADDVKTFIKHLVFPIETEIEDNKGIITIKSRDTKSRGILIGRGAKNLKHTKEIVQRHFDVKEIKVM